MRSAMIANVKQRIRQTAKTAGNEAETGSMELKNLQ
jgi:hypothetical protein